jgi:uroporphyrinogen III methyltransferase / synthase
MSGVVYLVGAGPGDPDLITVRGLRLLQQADVVVHDRLGTEALLAACRPDAELVNAGKAPGDVAMTQDEINAALIDHARAGKTVVRLKGGDPFVFGRGGEEALACAAAGIAWVVVPGLTSAIAAPAAGGIPVTHRAVATSFTVITGHEDPTKPSEQTDWATLARVPGTLVVLMGMGRLALIAEALIDGGRPPAQPAAAVQWGTTPRQRRVVATLSTLADECARQGVGSPAVVVIGDVAGLGLGDGQGPLAGRRVVVTRARVQASDLTSTLRALGADVVELPAIRIEPVLASAEIDAALDRLDDYGFIILTSANGVDSFFDRLADRGQDARAIEAATTVVAIGPATAAALADRGVRADIVPERFVAEGILEALAARDLSDERVLVARAREARADLIEGLRARGAEVDEVALYDTVPQAASKDEIEAALSADYLTFTSSSTVRNFMALLDDEGRRQAAQLRVVSIGPITSETARDEGLTVHREADEFTIPGLVAALLQDSEDSR